MKKKLGDTVLFTNQNVQGAVKQVSRAYVEHPKYPMTNRKAHHQALFTAAANFRRTFAKVLDHSWQGLPYGIESLAHFMKLATARHGDLYPGYILQAKDIRKPIPQPWPLATGSLETGIYTSLKSPRSYVLDTNIIVGNTSYLPTMGEFWKDIIQTNPLLRDGDLLTFITFTGSTNQDEDIQTGNFNPAIAQFRIDTQDTRANNTTNRTDGGFIKLSTEYNGRYYYLAVRHKDSNQILMHAGGLIISRLSPNGKFYQRNTAQMIVNSKVLDYYHDAAYIKNCIQSYLDPTVLSSDWYLNQLR